MLRGIKQCDIFAQSIRHRVERVVLEVAHIAIVYVAAAPALITPAHEVTGFDSGEVFLDDWLKKRALKNHASGASRCHGLRQPE